MILDKTKLDLNKLILYPHRPGIDQANYRVGIINELVLVWNPDTDTYMNYFYDDVGDKDTMFDLTLVYGPLAKGYTINRKGKIQGKTKEMKCRQDKDGYPIVDIGFTKNRKRCIIRVRIHLGLAKLFIPNIDPTSKIMVDHIDRNIKNLELTNLRWVSLEENNKNRYYKSKYRNPNQGRIYKAYEDKERTKLVFEVNNNKLKEKYISERKKISSDISRSIIMNTKCQGYYWIIEDTEIKNLLQLSNIDKIDDTLWVKHFSGLFYVHPLGLIKKGKYGFPNIGRIAGINRKERLYGGKRVHRLVAEVFLNNNSALKDGQVVDHVNADSLDNRVENLKICTQGENMQNPITKSKCSKKVIDSNGTIYPSLKECGKVYGVTDRTIAYYIKRLPEKGFKYYNDENKQ